MRSRENSGTLSGPHNLCHETRCCVWSEIASQRGAFFRKAGLSCDASLCEGEKALGLEGSRAGVCVRMRAGVFGPVMALVCAQSVCARGPHVCVAGGGRGEGVCVRPGTFLPVGHTYHASFNHNPFCQCVVLNSIHTPARLCMRLQVVSDYSPLQKGAPRPSIRLTVSAGHTQEGQWLSRVSCSRCPRLW